MNTAKVFWSGRSQAIRLPKEFRFDASTVNIRRSGQSIVLEPVAEDWVWLEAIQGQLDDDFIQATSEPMESQQRPLLDELFK